MQFISSSSSKQGMLALRDRLKKELLLDKKVLWLIPGGSNIPITVEIMNDLQKDLSKVYLSHLTLALTDERYGKVGHSDSNWKQLIDHNLLVVGVDAVKVLRDESLELTVKIYHEVMKHEFDKADIVIGQFGIGTDGHIAGVLPYSEALKHNDMLVAGYSSEKFIRVTLTPTALTQIDVAYVFAFGPSKKDPLLKLRDSNVSLDEQPAQVLKKIEQVFVYSDVI